MQARRWGPIALAVWTILIWTFRSGTIIADGDAHILDRLDVACFTLFAVATIVCVTRRRALLRPVVGAFAAWTVFTWVTGAWFLLTDDHSGPFVVIHLVIAVVSIGLAVIAWRQVARSTSQSLSVGR
jgi:hypothetical protein